MDVGKNTKCYRFESMSFEHGIYDDFVDCTYIIHLEGNGRKERVLKEIRKTPITRTTIILNNKGYRGCEKTLIEQAPYNDLTDAFLQCFKHAKENGHKNILVLEDDFIFDAKIKDPENINRVSRFVQSKAGEEFVYFIGAMPIVLFPTSDFHNYRAVKTMTTHSIIYSEKLIQRWETLNLEHKHWDVIIDKNVPNRYIFEKPLCYQTFPETENKKTWSEKDFSPVIGWFKNGFIRAFGMDVDPVAGFAFAYAFAKMLPWILVAFVVVLVGRVFYKMPAVRRLHKPRPTR